MISEARVEAAIETIPVPRHIALVRVTHWIIVLSAVGLLVSGIGILVGHPRLYWGETGSLATPSLIDLPIPFIIGPSVWYRPYHFFFAWILVLTGLVYMIGGFIKRHFRPASTDAASTYNLGQRLTYLAVVFVLFPAFLWTGLGMSFGMTSEFPFLATALGGHQSARTLHFVCVVLLLLFVAVHLLMIYLAGFWRTVRGMITGSVPQEGRGQ